MIDILTAIYFAGAAVVALIGALWALPTWSEFDHQANDVPVYIMATLAAAVAWPFLVLMFAFMRVSEKWRSA